MGLDDYITDGKYCKDILYLECPNCNYGAGVYGEIEYGRWTAFNEEETCCPMCGIEMEAL